MQIVTLFDPTAPHHPSQAQGGAERPALAALSGKVVGFIDNAKPNFDHLADDLGTLLKTKYGVARIVKRRKPSASVPARPELLDELSDECDVVITGSGD